MSDRITEFLANRSRYETFAVALVISAAINLAALYALSLLFNWALA